MFSVRFYKEKNVSDFMFASFDNEPLQRTGLEEQFYSFLYMLTPTAKEGKDENGRLPSLPWKSVPSHLKVSSAPDKNG